ncbi:hypothetical protein PsexTeo8_42870 [Pseudomonas extremaustralis]|nr:hypothetical protein [Pseudomonas extremaustralis]
MFVVRRLEFIYRLRRRRSISITVRRLAVRLSKGLLGIKHQFFCCFEVFACEVQCHTKIKFYGCRSASDRLGKKIFSFLCFRGKNATSIYARLKKLHICTVYFVGASRGRPASFGCSAARSRYVNQIHSYSIAIKVGEGEDLLVLRWSKSLGSRRELFPLTCLSGNAEQGCNGEDKLIPH